MLLTIHIAAGGLAIVLGAVALLAKKGGTIHRRSGLLFVYAMLVMGFSASILGFLKSPADGNVLTSRRGARLLFWPRCGSAPAQPRRSPSPPGSGCGPGTPPAQVSSAGDRRGCTSSA